MLNLLKRPINQLLLVLVIACFSLSIFRVVYSESVHYLFLVWNLFLAFVPLLIVQLPFFERSKNSFTFSMIAFCWLLFFPNAPYILTDLFHLSNHSTMPIWFDLVLILLYAWTGLLAGFYSLMIIEQKLQLFVSSRWRQIGVIGLIFLSSFGIYLGRYLRFNSWDLLNHPGSLLAQVFDRFSHPMDHPRTWGFTIFMGLFLSLIYFSINSFQKFKSSLNQEVKSQ
ncbi:MAG: DUF1361 domain-containing protein [Fluviicola sp.]|nr:DUF1361 domain-containing protein [Fluviicola sp.]